jgi:hypothetical protein
VSQVGELRKLQAAAMGQSKYVNVGEGSAKSREEATSLDSSHGKYEIHLNVFSFSRCYFNFGLVQMPRHFLW